MEKIILGKRIMNFFEINSYTQEELVVNDIQF